MRAKTVLRYYCEHCSKGLFKKHDMSAHEKRCFRNPTRVCETCSYPVSVRDLLDVFNACDLTSIREKSKGCPACIMAVIIQAFDGDSDNWVEFDYKKEMSAWYDKHNTTLVF